MGTDRRHRRQGGWRLLLLVAAVLLCAPAAAAARGVPPGWVGVMVDGPLIEGDVDPAPQFADMRAAGAGTVRIAFYWDHAQPYPNFAAVPPADRRTFESVGGVPTTFTFLDEMVRKATEAGLNVQPVVLRPPVWVNGRPDRADVPVTRAGRRAFRRFAVALVYRYGRGGPIRRWQIFNEPNTPVVGKRRQPIADYVRLLRGTYRAVKRADPRAQVMLAGMTGYAARALQRVYQAGGGRYFDVAAVHPFRREVRSALSVLRETRRVMRRHGDARKPLVVSELSWVSAKGHTTSPANNVTTELGQASRLYGALARIAAQRRKLGITAVIWSTWLSYHTNAADPFDWAGLRRFERGTGVVDKPALLAFRSAVRRISRPAGRAGRPR